MPVLAVLAYGIYIACRKIIAMILLINVVLLPVAMGQNRQNYPGPGNPGPIFFKNGAFKGTGNITNKSLNKDSLRPVHFRNNYYTLVQFDKLPGVAEKQGLAEMGVRLFDYIPGNAFLAELPDSFSQVDLARYAISGVYSLPAKFKTARELQQDGDQFARDPDKLIAVSFFGTLTPADARKELEQAGATLVPTKIQPPRTLFIRGGKTVLQRVAGLPFVSYLSPQSMKDRPLNNVNRAAHGLDALNAPSGRNLQGDGVVIGIGDNSDPYTHVDFSGRLIERFPSTVNDHGTHTSGTTAGGGILDPRYRGMAPHATLISQYFSDILANAPVYVSDYDMVLTNNSYTDYNDGCADDGAYDALANFMDAQLLAYPGLLHDFAAGNDGFYICTPFPNPFATIKSGFQAAKNVLTIGDLDNSSYYLNSGSSCGPVDDGRLKPEIVAGGTAITSTYPYNTYGVETGTSMASPTVTGTLALLYQRYRQLHGGTDPSGALIKAVACNSATDLGNAGPDFMYGFGSLNARTAVETIENNHYFTGTINNSGTNTFTLSGIPSGLQQIKIMLYWPDAPAAPYAATALVNNLDLTVTSPDGVLHHPLILNPDPAHVNDVAVEGVDTLNNIEQVVINNPAGGNFTITVNGTSIPVGPQNYVIAYQTIMPSVMILYPSGNETLVPGTPENIRWNAYGGVPNSFTVAYSPDNGSTWTTLSNSVPGTVGNAIPATSIIYPWTTPVTPTGQGLIRVTRNGTGYSDVSTYNFTILGQPVLAATSPCQGYAQLSWGSIPSATGYEVMVLKGDTMSTVARTTDTTWLLGNLNRDSSYWFAVRADLGSSAGRRSLAVNVTPTGGACTLAALNNDLTIDSIVAPLTGRQFTSTQLGNSANIAIEVRNLGTIPAGTPFTLSYQVNGGAIVTETCTATIAGGGTAYNYIFATPYDFSAPGVYTMQIWVDYPGDPQTGNDTLNTVIRQLQNAPVTLNPSFTEGFESAAAGTYLSPASGFIGLDRCDFTASDGNGRARTFINTGFARTGDRSGILDEIHYSSNYTTDSLVTTFNLANYSASDQLWLDFYYRNQGIVFNEPGNQVWIRGSDQSAWIPVYTLDISPGGVGIYQPSAHINITGILGGASPAQTVSSSFQIKFGEEGYTSANSVIPDGDMDNGYSFDDIMLTRSTNDIGMLSLVTPNLGSVCSLSNAEPISVWVKNYSSSTATNIPVTYSINGVNVTESIPSINAHDSVIYRFSQTANLSAYQGYTLSAWVSYPGDTYPLNDTLAPVITFQTTPLISTFPYLEGFESNNGNWYTNGTNDSWQWGTPAKTIINKAANGSKCWVTSLTGDYNNNELSYLYSPCFDLSGLTSPELSFSHIFQTEDDCDCDYHWAEYSTDGVNWIKLGTVDSGTNWYDNTARQAWQMSYTKWHVSSYDIPTHGTQVRFRIVMSSDPATTYEGVGIDDVHIFDKAPVYCGPSIPALVQPVSGSNWVNFDVGGNRILAINPNGQDLGNTNVEVFINQGPVRNDGKQYYLNRNIVIQPANVPTGNVSVQYYFLDSEADSLIDATGCDSCITIPDAYQAGIMQYSSPALSEEDSTLRNDSSGTFHYLQPRQAVSIIPNDDGYYAQYQVSGFSEFWINTGSPGANTPLPLALLSFTAARSGNTSALLQWSTTGESNTSRYIIQKSTDGVNFFSIDSVKAVGDSDAVNNYRYTDYHLENGVNYYRLRMMIIDQSSKYSPVRTVNDTLNSLVISIYPNPVQTGLLYITTSANCESIQLTDVSGRTVLRSVTGGLLNTLNLGRLAKGIYFVTVRTSAGSQVKKVLVE
jgi:subtilase family protein/type IX secretion system substrate protein/immune inhibitor InhA-like protein